MEVLDDVPEIEAPILTYAVQYAASPLQSSSHTYLIYQTRSNLNQDDVLSVKPCDVQGTSRFGRPVGSADVLSVQSYHASYQGSEDLDSMVRECPWHGGEILAFDLSLQDPLVLTFPYVCLLLTLISLVILTRMYRCSAKAPEVTLSTTS